jgi:hypothetical protein
MPPSQRITIRLSPELAARLAAKTGPRGNLADIVRQVLEAYLGEEPSSRQPRQPPVAATMADMADALAAVHTRLTALEQRREALEATRASGQQRQPSRQTPRQTPHPSTDAATAPTYDASKYVLRKLCPKRHEYGTTGMTLRRRHNQACPACATEWQQERRRQLREGEGA